MSINDAFSEYYLQHSLVTIDAHMGKNLKVRNVTRDKEMYFLWLPE